MATLNLKTWLTSSRFNSASYDDTTGVITLDIAPAITKDENVIKELILGLEESAQGKRINLNSPISEPAYETIPNYSITNRLASDNVTGEVQIEYSPQFVLWLKASSPLTADAVNDND